MARVDRRRQPTDEGCILSIGCGALIVYVAFWALVIFIALHFITKWW